MQDQMTHDDEINLLEYWGVIRKYSKFIIGLMLIVALAVAISSFFMDNMYQASAIIAPVDAKDKSGGLSSIASQFGGIAGLAGISMPGTASSNEIKSLLNSKVLKEKMIMQYNLLPMIFPDSWDEEKGVWKQPKEPMFIVKMYRSLAAKILSMLPSKKTAKKPSKREGVAQVGPSIRSGINALSGIISASSDPKTGMITVSAVFNDPETSAKLVEYVLAALTDHMSSEVKRVARTNRMYLEEQLNKAADPVARQKIYALLNQQIETILMAEVKENFAFKVIDGPMVPDRKIKPHRMQMVILSLVASAFFGVFLAFFLEYLQKMKEAGKKADSEEANS